MQAQGHNAMGQEEHKVTCEVTVIPITGFYDFIKYLKKSGTELFLFKKIHHSAGFCTPTHPLTQCISHVPLPKQNKNIF